MHKESDLYPDSERREEEIPSQSQNALWTEEGQLIVNNQFTCRIFIIFFFSWFRDGPFFSSAEHAWN